MNAARPSAETIDWLLDADPAIRWQVLRDLVDAPESEVAAERARVAREGWGAMLLAEQGPDGRWDGGVYRPGWVDRERPMFDAWTATHFSMQQLADLGPDPADPVVTRAIDLVRERVSWEYGGPSYFDGETEPCVNGVVLSLAAYFGQDGTRAAGLLLRTGEPADDEASGLRPDGGWNCQPSAVSSFHSTICALEGLLAWELAGHGEPRLAAARAAGEEYLLERALFRRRSDGSVADPRMTMLSYPVRWYHDVLRGLEHFRLADRRDPRLAPAVELLRSKADAEGRWRLENRHEGPTLFRFGEREGRPSRWVTLRALRVLRWWDSV